MTDPSDSRRYKRGSSNTTLKALGGAVVFIRFMKVRKNKIKWKKKKRKKVNERDVFIYGILLMGK
jgi:hypothetical protein